MVPDDNPIYSITLRKLSINDLDEIVRVENGAWRKDLRFPRKTIAAQFKENSESFIGYFENQGKSDELKGFVYYRRIDDYKHITTWKQACKEPLSKDGKVAYIVNVSVYPQKQGHGTRLMNGVARILEQEGIETLVLGSREITENFYKRCGYVPFERYKDWWPEDNESAGKGILMKREIKKRYH